ncbi:parathyroid hormone 4 [Denticeps clupeoides]|uniref:PTH4 protein n=1 Tax=Denticeps clupeoides TaxID=299321 RepID=A0AAY4C7Y4_9TELE|nr:parathyroid hormone 4-like [Denticeps clupeoides]
MSSPQKSAQAAVVLALLVFTVGRCQDNQRRAVTEHQLMHDRGRTIQSLKRLIWLSSAMEGLHTAQTRTVAVDDEPSGCHQKSPQRLHSQAARGTSDHQGQTETLLSDLFQPYMTGVLPNSEK